MALNVREVIEKYAAAQQGVVLASQFLEHEVSHAAIRHAVTAGRLVELFRGALALPGETNTERRAYAATLATGAGSALSHDTAAALFRFSGFSMHPLHISIPQRRKLVLPKDFVVHRPTRAFETNSIGKLRVTTMPRTILDCAARLRGFALEVMLDDAHQRFEGVGDRIRKELASLTRITDVPGGVELARLLDLREGKSSDSPEELRFWRLLRRSKLPPFDLQFPVYDASGALIMLVDFAWVSHRVAAHFDSYRWHARRTTFDDDAIKRGRLARAGWHNFIVTKATLDSGQCIEDLTAVLAEHAPQRRLSF